MKQGTSWASQVGRSGGKQRTGPSAAAASSSPASHPSSSSSPSPSLASVSPSAPHEHSSAPNGAHITPGGPSPTSASQVPSLTKVRSKPSSSVSSSSILSSPSSSSSSSSAVPTVASMSAPEKQRRCRDRDRFLPNPVIDSLLCPMECDTVVDFQTATVLPCSHVGCRACLEEALSRGGGVCPLCRKPATVKKLQPSLLASQICRNLVALCDHKECSWQGHWEQLEPHLAKECLYEKVSCGGDSKSPEQFGCGIFVRRKDLEEHRASCSKANIRCPHCQLALKNSDLVAHVSKDCEEAPLQCVHGCGSTPIPRSSMKSHLDKECPLALAECTFTSWGCDVLQPSSQPRHIVESHHASHQNDHLALVASKLSQLSLHFGTVSEKHDQQLSQIGNLPDMMRTFQLSLDQSLASKFQTQADMVNEVLSRVSSLESKVNGALDRPRSPSLAPSSPSPSVPSTPPRHEASPIDLSPSLPSPSMMEKQPSSSKLSQKLSKLEKQVSDISAHVSQHTLDNLKHEQSLSKVQSHVKDEVSSMRNRIQGFERRSADESQQLRVGIASCQDSLDVLESNLSASIATADRARSSLADHLERRASELANLAVEKAVQAAEDRHARTMAALEEAMITMRNQERASRELHRSVFGLHWLRKLYIGHFFGNSSSASAVDGSAATGVGAGAPPAHHLHLHHGYHHHPMQDSAASSASRTHRWQVSPEFDFSHAFTAARRRSHEVGGNITGIAKLLRCRGFLRRTNPSFTVICISDGSPVPCLSMPQSAFAPSSASSVPSSSSSLLLPAFASPLNASSAPSRSHSPPPVLSSLAASFASPAHVTTIPVVPVSSTSSNSGGSPSSQLDDLPSFWIGFTWDVSSLERAAFEAESSHSSSQWELQQQQQHHAMHPGHSMSCLCTSGSTVPEYLITSTVSKGIIAPAEESVTLEVDFRTGAVWMERQREAWLAPSPASASREHVFTVPTDAQLFPFICVPGNNRCVFILQ